MERTGKTFIIVTDDGLSKDVFLTFKDSDYGCTTVDWLEEMVEYDFSDTIEDALHKAELFLFVNKLLTIQKRGLQIKKFVV
jgi:hypothetical protein